MELDEQIAFGLRDQMKMDGRLRDSACGFVFAVEEGEAELIFYDDIFSSYDIFQGVSGISRGSPGTNILSVLQRCFARAMQILCLRIYLPLNRKRVLNALNLDDSVCLRQ